MKELQTRNLIVPVVGNFAGPKAIARVGTYLKAARRDVSAFYCRTSRSICGGTVCGRISARTWPPCRWTTSARSSAPYGRPSPRSPTEGFVMRLDPIAPEVRGCTARGQ